MCKLCGSDEPYEIKDVIGDANGDGSDADEWLLTLLLLLSRDTGSVLSQMTQSASSGFMSLYRPMLDELANAHGNASHLGRRQTGILTPMNGNDIAFGRAAAIEQAPYLQNFLRDLDNGRYTNADGTLNVRAIEARWKLYQNRIIGSANEAFALALPQGMKIWWRRGGAENSCLTCPKLEAGSPYTTATLPTYPRAGGTQCGTNCKCYLEAENGLTSFQI